MYCPFFLLFCIFYLFVVFCYVTNCDVLFLLSFVWLTVLFLLLFFILLPYCVIGNTVELLILYVQNFTSSRRIWEDNRSSDSNFVPFFTVVFNVLTLLHDIYDCGCNFILLEHFQSGNSIRKDLLSFQFHVHSLIDQYHLLFFCAK